MLGQRRVGAAVPSGLVQIAGVGTGPSPALRGLSCVGCHTIALKNTTHGCFILAC